MEESLLVKKERDSGYLDRSLKTVGIKEPSPITILNANGRRVNKTEFTIPHLNHRQGYHNE